LVVGAVTAICALTVVGLVAVWSYGWDAPGEAVTATVPGTLKQVVDAL
jgi:hypothetical protein